MATWNYKDDVAGKTVQFNNKSYVTRKDTGQTVYDHTVAPATDPGLANEIASLKSQLAAVGTGSGSGFGTVEFNIPDPTQGYYYKKINGSTSKSVREEITTNKLTMSDGSVPSAAVLFINCVNLNDSTFASPNKARAQMMYKIPGNNATPTCYINSRDGSGASASGVNFVTGTYTGDGTGTKGPSRYVKITAGQMINIGAKPILVRITGDRTQNLQSPEHFRGNNVTGNYDNYTYRLLSTTASTTSTAAQVVNITDTGFEVNASWSTSTSNPKGGGKTTYIYGPNDKGVVYTYEALIPTGQVSTTSTGSTYGPGTQAIVPVHADGTAKLIANLNKLSAGAVPADCWMEVWVLGLMGGGGTVPDNDYAGLVKRIEALEKTSTSVSGAAGLGTVAYTCRVSIAKGSKFTRGFTSVHSIEPVIPGLPGFGENEDDFSGSKINLDQPVYFENSSGKYMLQTEFLSEPKSGSTFTTHGTYRGTLIRIA